MFWSAVLGVGFVIGVALLARRQPQPVAPSSSALPPSAPPTKQDVQLYADSLPSPQLEADFIEYQLHGPSAGPMLPGGVGKPHPFYGSRSRVLARIPKSQWSKASDFWIPWKAVSSTWMPYMWGEYKLCRMELKVEPHGDVGLGGSCLTWFNPCAEKQMARPGASPGEVCYP